VTAVAEPSRSGLCASDKSLLHDEWKDFGVAMHEDTKGIAGHEGPGVVVAEGDDMHHKWKVGDRAGEYASPVLYALLTIQVSSGSGPRAAIASSAPMVPMSCTAPNRRTQDSLPPAHPSNYAIADGRYTSHLPDGVKGEEAGPIMCGGVTAYTACKRSGVRPGQWIVLPSAGGGLRHFAVQYAKAMVFSPAPLILFG
jgi:alcohol dehydrogenase, propanol-preferring